MREILTVKNDVTLDKPIMAYRDGDNPEAVYWPRRMNPPPFGFGATKDEAIRDLLDNEYLRSCGA